MLVKNVFSYYNKQKLEFTQKIWRFVYETR